MKLQTCIIDVDQEQLPISLPMDGAINCRDVGGYQTKEGKVVKTGKLFRSTELSTLTDTDLDLLHGYNITKVIDYRGTSEAKQAPDRLLKTMRYSLRSEGSDRELTKEEGMSVLLNLQQGENTFLYNLYNDYTAAFFADRYQSLFSELLTLPEDEALLYHCTGGRDRTGMATALVLHLLGVPMETIEADFLASNVFLKERKKTGDTDLKDLYATLATKANITAEEVEQCFELTPDLLRVFFATLTKEHGSLEQFYTKGLRLTAGDIQTIRRKYTE